MGTSTKRMRGSSSNYDFVRLVDPREEAVLRKLGVIAALLVVASICLGEGLKGKFTGLDGATHTLGEQRGHVTVVNLWVDGTGRGY